MSAPAATPTPRAGAVSPAWVPHGLPIQLTRLVGRTRELEEAKRLLRSTRLLTLTGAGGSGKTRLAVEVAAQVAADFSDGVVWVELANLKDPALLPQQVSMALGRPESRERSAIAELHDVLRTRSLLLVLDNCEHHVNACAHLAEALLRGCPELRILATSREALGIGGERAWLIPPLSLPAALPTTAADVLAASEAVQLFVERAQAVAPDFSLTDSNASAVAQICRRLDGIPLAIELAAARVKVLAPEQIAARLDDSFRLLTTGGRTALPRHRTLREAIDWSYALLSEREQVAFQRLSVFAGGFPLEAAEAVCAAPPIDREEVLDLLSALVDKSLVLTQSSLFGTRYRLLETVRQYARDRHRGTADAEQTRERHAHYFRDWAEAAEPHLFGGAGKRDWIVRVGEEYDNIRAAKDWSLEDPGRIEVALRLVNAIHWYWFARGRFREGHLRLMTSLQQSGGVSPLVRARALAVLASMAVWQGDYHAIRAPAEESVAILRGQDDSRALAYALTLLGIGICMGGEPEASRPILDEAVATARRLGETVLLSFTLYWCGIAAQARSEIDRARACLQEASEIGRRLDHRPAIAHPLVVLGRLTLATGETELARAQLVEGLALHGQTEDRWGAVMAIEALARVAAATARPDRAVRMLGAAATIREGMSAWLPPDEQNDMNRLADAARASLGAIAYDAAWDEGYAMEFERAVAFALDETAPPDPAQEPAPDRRADASKSVAPEPVAPAPVPAPALPASRAVPALRVLALGPLLIFRAGELLDGDVWSSIKPRELLLFLLRHPDGCTREQVGLALWPDASAAQVRNNFHVTLHRLRKGLGHPDWIALAGDRYRFDPAIDCEFDAAVFEREVTASLRDLRAGRDAAARLAAALDLYRGEFLEGEIVGDWHLEHRDRLHRVCVDGLHALGLDHFSGERYAEATVTFERLISREDLHEGAYRHLMMCYARMGERNKALRLYHRLIAVLQDEMDAETEPETAELFTRLQAAQPI